MPCVASLQAKNSQGSKNKPESFSLLLPSVIQHQVPCDTNLQQIEWELHTGQAYDALEELRQGLRSCSYMECFKDRFLRGQGANTRARNSLKAMDAKIQLRAADYRTAYCALQELSTLLRKTGSNANLRPLEDGDICPMTAGTEDRSSKGRWHLSWIWLLGGYSKGTINGDRDPELQNGK